MRQAGRLRPGCEGRKASGSNPPELNPEDICLHCAINLNDHVRPDLRVQGDQSVLAHCVPAHQTHVPDIVHRLRRPPWRRCLTPYFWLDASRSASPAGGTAAYDGLHGILGIDGGRQHRHNVARIHQTTDNRQRTCWCQEISTSRKQLVGHVVTIRNATNCTTIITTYNHLLCRK
jgi:hypothetical protein